MGIICAHAVPPTPDSIFDLFSWLRPALGVLVEGHSPGRTEHGPVSASPSDSGKVLSQRDREALQANCIPAGGSGAHPLSSAYTREANDGPTGPGVLCLLCQWLGEVACWERQSCATSCLLHGHIRTGLGPEHFVTKRESKRVSSRPVPGSSAFTASDSART